MNTQYKHKVGIIKSNNGIIEIKREQLEDEGFRTKYKSKIIYNETEEYRLFIRSRGKSSHFYSRGISRKAIYKKQYTEPHKEKINILYNYIKARDRIRICCYVWEYGKKSLETIFSFKDYHFKKEVKRSLDSKNYFVSDIFGISQSLNKSDREPLISIEVIDTHFPDFKTFNHFRNATKNNPFIIVFYYLDHEPRINQMVNNKGGSNNGKLRISHYIQDGSFWVGDERIEEKDYSFIKTYNQKINFKDDEQYYNSIKELELNRIKQ